MVKDTEVKFWDASAGWWINPKQFGGYGAVRAVRVFDTQASAVSSFNWGKHRIEANRWEVIERA